LRRLKCGRRGMLAPFLSARVSAHFRIAFTAVRLLILI
jgi:hypothetical protein